MTWSLLPDSLRKAPLSLLAVVAVTLAVLALLGMAGRWLERRRQRDMRQKFRHGRPGFHDSRGEGRHVPRRVLPANLPVWITLTEPDRLGQKARVLDLSAGGMAIEPDFPLKMLPPGTELASVLFEAPTASLVIRRARTVRLEHEIKHRRLALQIVEIEADQQEVLDRFMARLGQGG